jgi:hypothetical protein
MQTIKAAKSAVRIADVSIYCTLKNTCKENKIKNTQNFMQSGGTFSDFKILRSVESSAKTF